VRNAVEVVIKNSQAVQPLACTIATWVLVRAAKRKKRRLWYVITRPIIDINSCSNRIAQRRRPTTLQMCNPAAIIEFRERIVGLSEWLSAVTTPALLLLLMIMAVIMTVYGQLGYTVAAIP